VRDELPASAVSEALPAYAAAAAASAVQQSIDISCPPGAQQQTAAAAGECRDRRTDGRPTVA